MEYSYDRTAADKAWYDIRKEAEAKFCADTLKALVKILKVKGASIRIGTLSNAEATFKMGDADVTVAMGFRGGTSADVYIEASDGVRKFKRQDASAILHTASSFAELTRNMLEHEGWPVP